MFVHLYRKSSSVSELEHTIISFEPLYDRSSGVGVWLGHRLDASIALLGGDVTVNLLLAWPVGLQNKLAQRGAEHETRPTVQEEREL